MYKWVNEIVPEASLRKVDVDIGDVIAQKGVHYGSGIAYISAKVEDEDGERENYDFLIKYGLTDSGVRRKLRMDVLFEREIEIYTKLLPNYHKLEIENGLEPIDFLPKCYKTEITDDQEIMIFEDLRKESYMHWRKTIPMNLEHIKAILKCYGKWHALSYALKDQKREQYEQIVEDWSTRHPLAKIMESHIGNWINMAHKRLYEIMEEMEETELLDKYKEKIRNLEPREYFQQLFKEDVDQSVVVHGDCTCYNFLFKYEASDPDRHCPKKVKILDFQVSHLGSPVFDVSFFIYIVSSENQLEFIRELLECYYTAFATHLTKLGSDPKKIFSFADLALHWEKYAAAGALFQPFILALSLSNEDQAPDVGKEEDCKKWLEVTKTEEFCHRALVVARNFVYFEFM